MSSMPTAIQPAASSSTWQTRLMTSSSPTIAANDASSGFEPAAAAACRRTKVLMTRAPAPPIAAPGERGGGPGCAARPAPGTATASTAVSKTRTSTRPTSRSGDGGVGVVASPTRRAPVERRGAQQRDRGRDGARRRRRPGPARGRGAIEPEERRRGLRRPEHDRARGRACCRRAGSTRRAAPTRATVPVQPKTDAFSEGARLDDAGARVVLDEARHGGLDEGDQLVAHDVVAGDDEARDAEADPEGGEQGEERLVREAGGEQRALRTTCRPTTRTGSIDDARRRCRARRAARRGGGAASGATSACSVSSAAAHAPRVRARAGRPPPLAYDVAGPAAPPIERARARTPRARRGTQCALQGVGVGRGVAVGPVLRMPEPLPEPGTEGRTADAAAESAAVATALAAVASDLTDAGAQAGGEAKDVLDAPGPDGPGPDPRRGRRSRASTTARTGERAVFEAFADFQEMLVGMGGYMAERATDLGDVAQRVIAALRGVPAPGRARADTPFVLVARDLAPADTALLDLEKVLALITRDGGPTSHTAILARVEVDPRDRRRRPAPLDSPTAPSSSLDAATGVVTVDPSDDEVADAEQRIADRAARGRRPDHRRRARRRHAVPLLANLGSPEGRRGAPSSSAPRASACSAPSSCSSTRRRARPSQSQTGAVHRAARGVPRQEGRRARARRRRRQAAQPSSTTPTRRTPRSASAACVRSAPRSEILRDQLSALAEAQARDRRPTSG